MNRKIAILSDRGRRVEARLTTEHSASSYGLPVLVIDGEALGPADLEARHPGYRFLGSQRAQELARRAGYRPTRGFSAR